MMQLILLRMFLYMYLSVYVGTHATAYTWRWEDDRSYFSPTVWVLGRAQVIGLRGNCTLSHISSLPFSPCWRKEPGGLGGLARALRLLIPEVLGLLRQGLLHNPDWPWTWDLCLLSARILEVLYHTWWHWVNILIMITLCWGISQTQTMKFSHYEFLTSFLRRHYRQPRQ